MAKKPAGKLAGKSVAFVGKFGYGNHELDMMKALVAQEGGSVVDGAKSAADVLVAGAGPGGNPPAAIVKIQKKHPQVHVIDQPDFYQMAIPTAEEFRELMLSGPHGHDFWNAMQSRLQKGGATLDLSGTDFRNCTIEGALDSVCLDDCDFRGATISAAFDRVTGAKFDAATMTGGAFTNADDCSLKNVTMDDIRWNRAVFVRCDFSGGKLNIRSGSFTTATECIFKKADLQGAVLEQSKFALADFSGANLANAKLQKCDFTGANLSGADLSGADLRNATLASADLRKAKLHDAILSGVDLTGATIDGADFTGANVAGAKVAGLDLSRAKNFVETAARTAGPNIRQLGKVAAASKRCVTTIEIELGNDEYVVLEAAVATYASRAYPSATHTHHRKNAMMGYVDAPSFEQGMLNLADLWSRGTPRFDAVVVKAKECPKHGKELKDLAIAAWHEAFGLPVPTADELEKAAENYAAANAGLRETMIAELGGGVAGVKKWNARSEKERSKLGKLRKHDFTNAKLAEVRLNHQDLEGSRFDGANLKKASFEYAQLKGASFVKAELGGASFVGAKCSDASFEGADLRKCHLRAANFRRCNFANADLSKSNFRFSDLCGADFTNATLDDVVCEDAKFDDKTIFPAGFLPPEGLDWKGVGVRPGTPPPPPPPKSGTLDFDAFLEQLNNKVELARMEKAGSMLKAERFQLFAEVKDDCLVGIVKSQSNQDLVYSCRLAANGAFGCCTQNLRPCGGLRGALCKHLLVLIIGLAKAGQLDSATVDHWIDLSRSQKPAIDDESMSATFLRYKGAEAGEVDWRPTETIPEDFYAM